MPNEHRECPVCGEMFAPCKPTSTTCSRQCANTLISRRTAKQRGDTQRGRGEGKAYRKRGGEHEHRVVAEEMLGRPLRPGEVVHHRNGDRLDNRPENLEVLRSQAEHAREHSLGRRCPEGCSCARHDASRWRRRKGGVAQ